MKISGFSKFKNQSFFYIVFGGGVDVVDPESIFLSLAVLISWGLKIIGLKLFSPNITKLIIGP